MTMNSTVAGILIAILVDPSTEAADAAAIIRNALGEGDAKRLLMILAALHSECVQDTVDRSSVTSKSVALQRLKEMVRQNHDRLTRELDGTA